MTEEQASKIGLFFLFSLMDEKVALQAGSKAVATLKARFPLDAIPDFEVIAVLRKLFDQHRKLLPRNRAVTTPIHAWDLASGVDLQLWGKFQKDAPEQEVVAVILSRLLSFSDASIAAGLNISPGTARYRIGKGVRQLGLTRIGTNLGAKA